MSAAVMLVGGLISSLQTEKPLAVGSDENETSSQSAKTHKYSNMRNGPFG